MSQIIALKIDIAKADKSRYFTGKNGALYLDAVLYVNDEPDKYGNCGMIVQSVGRDERANGVKGNILGNGKIVYGEGKPRASISNEPEHISKAIPSAAKKPTEDNSDLPF